MLAKARDEAFPILSERWGLHDSQHARRLTIKKINLLILLIWI
jgi:hypothetical protein